MANIELVIKIPEEIRLALINNIQLSLDQQSICDSCIKQAIINGTPLDEIRAEIEQNAYPIVHGVNNHERGMTLYGILQIIDKYREESDKE